MNLTKFFIHTATYWSRGTPDGFGGYSWSSPTEISVRWESKNEIFKDEQGEDQVSNAIIYTDQDLEIGAYIYKGSSAATDPTTLADSHEIKQVNATPSIDGTQELIKMFL